MKVNLITHSEIGNVLNQEILITEIIGILPKNKQEIQMLWIYIPLLQKHILSFTINKKDKEVIYSGINQDQAVKFWNAKLIYFQIV